MSDKDWFNEQISECRQYSVSDIFCCEWAPYYWQAVKIRYPEYCGDLGEPPDDLPKKKSL